MSNRVLFKVAIVVIVINVAGGIFAYLTDEPIHGLVHGAFAVGFGLWARYLKLTAPVAARQVEQPDKVQMLEADVTDLERELQETRERLAFADQLLKNKPPKT